MKRLAAIAEEIYRSNSPAVEDTTEEPGAAEGAAEQEETAAQAGAAHAAAGRGQAPERASAAPSASEGEGDGLCHLCWIDAWQPHAPLTLLLTVCL